MRRRRWTPWIAGLVAAAAILTGSAVASAEPATEQTVGPLFERTERAAQELVVSAEGAGTSETRAAFRAYAGEMEDIEQELAALEWAPADENYRDVLLGGYAAIVEDAEAVADGRMTPAQFAAAFQQRGAYVQGQIDQDIAQRQEAAEDDGLIDGWPFPLNEWWFWILVVFGPAIPIALSVIFGAGAGIAGAWNWMRGRRHRA